MIHTQWTVTVDTAAPLSDEMAFLLGEQSVETTATEPTEQETHKVVFTFSRIWSRMTLSIDGECFLLPCGFLGLTANKREIFRLGDEQVVLSVEKSGRADLILRGETVPPDAV